MMTVQQAFVLAVQYHQADRFAEAEALYRQILAVAPSHADAWHYLGLIAHRMGDGEAALRCIHQAVALIPNDAVALCNLGVVLAEHGKVDDAIVTYRRAIELRPDYPESYNNLGNALSMRGERPEAIAEFRRALEIKPDYPEAYNNLGNVLRETGRSDEAMEAYRCAIQCNPQFAKAYNNMAGMLVERGQIMEAIEVCRRALEIQPDYAEAHNNLGNGLREAGCLDDAIAAYREAILLKPDCAEAFNNLGVALNERGQLEEAVAACRRALEIRPAYPEACNSLGNALNNLGRFEEAVAAYRRGIQLNPNYVAGYGNLGVALAKVGQLDDAVAAYQRALQLNPDDAPAYSNLGNALKDQGKAEETIAAFRRAHALAPGDAGVHSNLIYSLYLAPGVNWDVIAAEHEQWNRQYADPAKSGIRAYSNVRDVGRRLRIGYVSPDFFDHVVGRNLTPLFNCHDYDTFDIACYSSVIKPDDMTAKLRQRVSLWREIAGLSSEAVAEMIREDGVDILVDLSQHTAGNRLPVFARQPAPVQVSFAGYPETTGVKAVGYRISDPWLEGEMADGRWQMANDARELRGKERVFLIDSFWCYEPCGVDIAVNELPAKENGCITFGSLNNFCKINEPVLRLWGRVLGAVKASRLMILSAKGSHRQRVLEVLAREGVERERVTFVEPCARKAYLALYHRLDLVLDTFPYNGHTTSLDALWMGVPVVSLAGAHPVMRAGLSQLSNLNLRELVAFSEDQYVKIASRLAGDLPRLAELRRTLRTRMETSVLMDARRFARNIEAAYRAMWRQWCAKEADA